MIFQNSSINGIYVKIWIILPEFTGIIILQVTEHRTVPHSMSIYYRVFIRKILLIVNIQEDCSQRIFVRRKCFLQIFTVIRSLNNRIIDLTRLIRESDPCDRIRIDLQQFLKINRECIISVFTMIFIFIIFILIIRHRKFPHFIILTSSIQITFSDLKQLKARHTEYDQCDHKNHIGDYIPFFLPPSSAVMFFSFIVCIFISHSGFDPSLCCSIFFTFSIP